MFLKGGWKPENLAETRVDTINMTYLVFLLKFTKVAPHSLELFMTLFIYFNPTKSLTGL